MHVKEIVKIDEGHKLVVQVEKSECSIILGGYDYEEAKEVANKFNETTIRALDKLLESGAKREPIMAELDKIIMF